MRAQDLKGADLDYWVARAIGAKRVQIDALGSPIRLRDDGVFEDCRFSIDWGQGGPIIDKYRPELRWLSPSKTWQAEVWIDHEDGSAAFWICRGPTPLIATMRAVVAVTFGEVVPEGHNISTK